MEYVRVDLVEAAEQQGYANAMEAERKLHEARMKELEAKLATCEKYKAAYAECDRIGTQAVRELEAENKRLNEQMDVIEEMGTESLNALPDCLMRLAPALVENDELKAKLAKAVEGLERIGSGEFSGQMLTSMPPQDAAAYFARTTLAAVSETHKLKGETDE